MRQLKTIAAAAALTSFVVGTNAHAQTASSSAQCMNAQRSFAADVAVGGCNAVIDETTKNLATAYFFRAAALRAKGDVDRALTDYDQAIKLSPDDGELRLARAAAFEAKGDRGRAMAEYDQVIKLNPKIAAGFNARAAAFHRSGDLEKAAADYGEVTRLQPDNAEAWSSRCWVRAAGGRDPSPALPDCNAALKIKPNMTDALDTRGFIYLRMGRADAALADYDAVLKLDPKQPGSLYGRGLAKQRRGDRTGSADIAAAKAIKPNIADEFSRYGLR